MEVIDNNSKKMRGEKNSSNYNGKYRDGQKTTGDKTGQARSVYRTVHLCIYEAFQNQWQFFACGRD